MGGGQEPSICITYTHNQREAEFLHLPCTGKRMIEVRRHRSDLGLTYTRAFQHPKNLHRNYCAIHCRSSDRYQHTAIYQQKYEDGGQ